MKPSRRTYLILGRSCCDLPVPVLRFRTALDLDKIRGLRQRLKDTMGGKTIRLINMPLGVKPCHPLHPGKTGQKRIVSAAAGGNP